MANITTNADFLLTVGVDVGLSLEPMQKGLEELVKTLNSKPLLIKFEADTSSMEAQIAKVTGSDSSSKKRQSSAKQTSKAYKEATQAINQYYAKLKQLSLAEKEAFDTYNKTGTPDSKYSSLITELNHLKAAYDNAIAGKNSMTAAEQTEITNLDTAKQIELATAIERRTNAVLQNNAAMTSSQTALNQAYATLARCTKAENSHKQSSRDAVVAIRNKMAAVVQARKAVEDGSASDEEAAQKVRVLQEAERDLRQTIKESTGVIQENGDMTKTLGERLGGLAKKFTSWFSVSQLIMAAYRAIRKMISAVIELDTAMTELKKVTDESDATYEKFLTNAAARAKKLGASLTDVVNTTADFARLGLSLEDAEAVSDAALVYKNVGDGIEDIDQASESLISTMQAFGVEATAVMSIVDKFNVTGNKFAISSGGVGDALLNSAAALNAAGNSLDESIGLITAANTTIQDPEKVGTALKTISMYLRAAKTEAEDAGESTEGMANSVSELRDEILSLTGNRVDIQIDENTFKSTYEILKDLSEVWGDLSDISQANITELIGGKRNSNVISALLKDFEIAEDVIEQTSNSSGSALEENAKVLESIQGKINVLKATFQEFSNNLIGSDIVKMFVDLGTWIMTALNWITKAVDALGGMKTVLLGVASVLMIAKAEWIAHMLAMIKNFIVTTLTNGFHGVISAVKTLISIIPAAITAWKGYAAGTVTASAAMQASIPVIGLVLAGLTVLTAGMALASDTSSEMAEEIDDSTTEIQQLADAAADSSDKITDLALSYLEAHNALNTLTGTVEAYKNAQKDLVDGLKIEQTELQKLIDKYGEYDKALIAASVQQLKDDEIDLRSGLTAAEDAVEVTSQVVMVQTEGLEHNAEEVTAAYDALVAAFEKNQAEATELNVGINFGKGNVLNDADEVVEGYMITITDATDEAVEKYGHFLANKIQEYTSYKWLLGQLSDQGIGAGNVVYDGLMERYNGVKQSVEGYLDAADKLNENLANQYILQQALTDGYPSTEAEFDTFRQSVIDAATASDEFCAGSTDIAGAIDNVLASKSQFTKFFDDITNSTNNATNAQKSFAAALSSVQALDSGFEQLDKIYADIYDKEDFDWSSIIGNEDFAAAFGSLGDTYADFIKTVANSPSDIHACQDAFNNLATAYLLNSDVLSGVTEETRKATIAMLEQMGVANAAALVDEQLALAKERTRIATEAGANATFAQVLELYDEETASRITAQAIYELAIAKIQTNENALLTSSDIAQLEALAEAAGATAESLLNVAKAKSYITQAEALEKQKADLIAQDADPRGISVVSTQAANYRLWAEELLNKKITYEVDFKRASYTGGSSTKSARSSAAKAAEKEAKEAETWFERQLKDHQHLVAMEQETEAEYLAWLNKAYKQAYNEGIIELDDYYKYQEEIYEGLRDLFMDSLGDVEHEISMRENYDGEEKKIIALYQGLMKDVEKEIAAARAQGLTDEDDYIQELQEKWQDYANAIKDIREEIEEAAKDALDEMIDYRVDMLKQEIEDEKDALDKKLDNLKEFYDKQKEMLQDKYDEEKYLEDQAEKRKSVSDIKGELAMLENDDSAWAQKRKLELTEELTDAEKDLADFEKENALDKALDAIDEAYNSQEAQLQREMDALDEKLNDPNALFNQALEDIKNNSKNQLYYQMLMYNRQYGDGNDETVKKLWEDTYGALNDYEKLFGKLYKGVDLKNETGVKDDKGWDDEKVSGTNPDNKPKDPPKTTTTTTKPTSTAPSLSSGSTVTIKKTATHFGSKSKGVKMASFVPGGSYTVYQTSGNQVLIGRNGVYTGWVNKSDIVGYASGTKHATAGLHELFEQGDEYIFSASDGSRYRMFSGGEKVLNAKATEFLYDFANSGGDVLAQMLKNVFGGTGLDGITPTVINNEINMGDIIITGSATQKTVSEIRREQRSAVNYMLQEFNKLSN